MSRFLNLEVERVGNHWTVWMRREYDGRNGGGTHVRKVEYYSTTENMALLAHHITALENSFPTNNPNPRTPDSEPKAKSSPARPSDIAFDPDLYP